MNILIVTGIFPPDVGGPATYVPLIAAGLTSRGHQVTVLTLSETVNPHGSWPFAVVRLARSQFKPWRWLRTVFAIWSTACRADLLFVNGLAMEATLANFLLRKPLVMKVVGDLAWERATNRSWTQDTFADFQSRRYGLRVKALRALRSWWTRRADKVIVPSRYLARVVAGWGVPEARIHVIYNAVEPPADIVPARVPLEASLKIATVGRLIPLKRIHDLLEVAAELPQTGVVVIGDGPELSRLRGLAQALGIAERVYFAGQRSRAETLALMKACDVLVLNSTHEGFPHVALEAMSLGLPVVAPAVGGVPEVVENEVNGLLTDGTRQDLLHALQRLTKEFPLRRLLASEAQGRARERFASFTMIERTEALLAETAGAHSRAALQTRAQWTR